MERPKANNGKRTKNNTTILPKECQNKISFFWNKGKVVK